MYDSLVKHVARAILSPAQTAIEEKTSENESIAPAKRATLPLTIATIPFKMPSARRIIVESFAAFSPFLKDILFSSISDSPSFPRLHLISCLNALIVFQKTITYPSEA